MHRKLILFVLGCCLGWSSPISAAQYWTNKEVREALGPCPSYRRGIEIGYAFAEPYGALQFINPKTREKNRIYAEELAVTLRIVNRNNFDDRLESVSTPIAAQAGIKQVRQLPQQTANALNQDYNQYIYPVDELGIAGSQYTVGDPLTSDEEFLSIVELRENDLFIHIQDVRQIIYYGDMIPLQLIFANAGAMTVYAQLRARKEIDNKYRFKVLWPSCS
ncbi:MAG: hypothetical protein EYC62_02585 [Alphaproteobacteria bacterium]|nr:MAG: hypothetical protein EYC62_02585 [Alphaproteobacteria bacterium]